MTAEELLKRWASQRLDIPVEKIDRVTFSKEPAVSYSEYTEEPAVDEARVWLNEPMPYGTEPTWMTTERWIDVSDLTFADLLAEVLS